jgi:cytochrome P450
MMARKAENDGIWIEGSATVVAGAMAAGTGATAMGSTQYSGAPANLEDLRAALDSLIAQLRSAPAGVDDPEALVQVAVSAQREARKGKPDKRILSGLLQALMAGVTNSAALANAVVAIQHAVSILL